MPKRTECAGASSRFALTSSTSRQPPCARRRSQRKKCAARHAKGSSALKVQTLEHSVRARDATIKSLQARLKKEIERAQSRAGRARERIRDSTGSSPAAAVPQAEALRLARLYTQRNDDLKRQLEKSRQQLKSTQSALEDTHLKLQAALRGGRERREGRERHGCSVPKK